MSPRCPVVMSGPLRNNPETPSGTWLALYQLHPHAFTRKPNGRCCLGKLAKTKYLSWVSHARKISFPFLGFFFSVGGRIAGPAVGGACSRSRRAAAVLILGLASKHSHSRLALGSGCCWCCCCSPCQRTGADIFPIWSFSDVLVVFASACFSSSSYSPFHTSSPPQSPPPPLFSLYYFLIASVFFFLPLWRIDFRSFFVICKCTCTLPSLFSLECFASPPPRV